MDTIKARITAFYSLNVRTAPSITSNKVGMLPFGREVEIIEHTHISPTEIWGRTKYGWIALMVGNSFFTTCKNFANLPSVTPPEFPHIYRIKDDLEAGIEPEGTRPYLREGLPSTVRLRGGAYEYFLTPKWLAYLKRINTVKAYNYLIKDDSGWHNQGPYNLMQQLTFSGNIVEVTRIEENRAYIKSYVLTEDPPTEVIKPVEKTLHPMVHMFSTQYKNKLDMSTDGRYPRTILLRNADEEIWINLADIVRI